MIELIAPIDVAKMMGVHRNTIYRYMREKDWNIPIIRVGRKDAIRFDKKDVESFIDRNKRLNEKIFRPRI